MVEGKKKEPYVPRQCEATTAEGKRCVLYALTDSEEPFCHYHHPARAEQRRAAGVAVGKLPKIRMSELDFKSLEDLIDFAKKRMMLIATRAQKITPLQKEQLLINWSSFLAPLLAKRDTLSKRIKEFEEERRGRT